MKDNHVTRRKWSAEVIGRVPMELNVKNLHEVCPDVRKVTPRDGYQLASRLAAAGKKVMIVSNPRVRSVRFRDLESERVLVINRDIETRSGFAAATCSLAGGCDCLVLIDDLSGGGSSIGFTAAERMLVSRHVGDQLRKRVSIRPHTIVPAAGFRH